VLVLNYTLFNTSIISRYPYISKFNFVWVYSRS